VVVASRRQEGIAMLELLVALLVFSIGMLGLLSGQLEGKWALHDALQRSAATGLARDLLERIHANPAHVQAYRVGAIGAAGHSLPGPAVDCGSTACTGAELAAFDLWQWEARLHGGGGEQAGTGGLVSPRACIAGEGVEVVLAISWSGFSPAVSQQALSCAMEDDVGAFSRPRHRLDITTRLDTSPW
jgi:type IV pilus assembly protein PilV